MLVVQDALTALVDPEQSTGVAAVQFVFQVVKSIAEYPKIELVSGALVGGEDCECFALVELPFTETIYLNGYVRSNIGRSVRFQLLSTSVDLKLQLVNERTGQLEISARHGIVPGIRLFSFSASDGINTTVFVAKVLVGAEPVILPGKSLKVYIAANMRSRIDLTDIVGPPAYVAPITPTFYFTTLEDLARVNERAPNLDVSLSSFDDSRRVIVEFDPLPGLVRGSEFPLIFSFPYRASLFPYRASNVGSAIFDRFFELEIVVVAPPRRIQDSPPLSLSVLPEGEGTIILTDFIEDPQDSPLTFSLSDGVKYLDGSHSGNIDVRVTFSGSVMTVMPGDVKLGNYSFSVTAENEYGLKEDFWSNWWLET